MRLRASIPLLVLLAITASPRQSRAQFVSMDRQDASNRLDLQTDVLLYEELASQGFFVRNEVYVQGGGKGWGGYGRFVASSIVSYDFDDTNAIGNLELGLLHDMDFPLMAITLHLGVTLPTAGTDADERVANEGAPFGRLTDVVTAFADKIALRIGASLRMPANLLFFRFDTGVDLLFRLEDQETDEGTEPLGALFRANLGIGLRYRLLGASLEYAAVAPVTGGSVDFRSNSYFHTLTVGVRALTPWVQPFVGLTLPLDTESIGKIWVVAVGVGARL